jgi:hypothetical protein
MALRKDLARDYRRVLKANVFGSISDESTNRELSRGSSNRTAERGHFYE